MGLKLWILAILLCVAQSASSTYSGQITPSTTVLSSSYNISAGDTMVSVKFEITNLQYSYTVIYVSFQPLTFNLTPTAISMYLQNSSPELSYMDPISAIGGIPQRVNLRIPSNKNIVYVTIFNLDNPEITITKYYNLVVNLPGSYYSCNSCPFGSFLSFNSNDCQCYPCLANYVGPTCRFFLNRLTSSITLDVSNEENQYFIINSPSSSTNLIVKQLTNTNKTYLYVQYQYTTRMIAGKINSYYQNSNNSYQYLITNSQKTITIPSNGFNILLTLQNYDTNISSISIKYNDKPREQSSIIIVIIAICGSVVAAIIVLVVFFKVRNNCLDRHAVVNVNPAVIINQNNLTDRQINKYFPQVLAFTIFCSDANSSSISDVNINNESLNGLQCILQCSICFDGIKKNDFIRATYCKHVFHSKCLIEWFHKNQTCPNCRQHFDYKTTKKFRQKMPRSIKSKPNNLVKAILGQNYLQQHRNRANMVVQKQFKIQKQHQISIQSKNLNPLQEQDNEN